MQVLPVAGQARIQKNELSTSAPVATQRAQATVNLQLKCSQCNRLDIRTHAPTSVGGHRESAGASEIVQDASYLLTRHATWDFVII